MAPQKFLQQVEKVRGHFTPEGVVVVAGTVGDLLVAAVVCPDASTDDRDRHDTRVVIADCSPEDSTFMVHSAVLKRFDSDRNNPWCGWGVVLQEVITSNLSLATAAELVAFTQNVAPYSPDIGFRPSNESFADTSISSESNLGTLSSHPNPDFMEQPILRFPEDTVVGTTVQVG